MSTFDASHDLLAGDGPTAGPGEDSDALDDGGFVPGRARRRWLTPRSALLLAVIVGFVGFYAGVREEKSHASGSTSAGAVSAASTARGSSSRTGRFPSFGAGAPGAAAGGGATTGTVSSIKGDTVYVKESSGNTVAVKLLDTTKVTKSESVSGNSVHPGDSVVIEGSSGSSGTVTATAVTDEGDDSTSTASTSSTTSAAG
jgi:hypothetical protein